jgi:UPF0271 protein
LARVESEVAASHAYDPRVRIDLNADVGESFGAWELGEDETLIPLVTSVNIACGFHAGDPLTIGRTVATAVRAGAAIGAHPGYADLPGFGRREVDLPAAEIEALVLYQLGALAGFVSAAGGELRHVKPHGALYNRSARDPATAEAVARAVRGFSADLILVGLSGSASLAAAEGAGLKTAAEAFADRAYEPDGTLRSRRLEGAVLDDPEACAEQARRIVRERRPEADTLCIHGDRPGATARAAAVRRALEADGAEIRALDVRRSA